MYELTEPDEDARLREKLQDGGIQPSDITSAPSARFLTEREREALLGRFREEGIPGLFHEAGIPCPLDEKKEGMPAPSGHVYTANQRVHDKIGKSVIQVRIDRPSGSVLQNRHPMRGKTATERARVIALNKADLERDRRVDGPMTQELRRIAAMVADGHEVALMCWCSPLPCHGDHYVEEIRTMAAERAAGRSPDKASPEDRQATPSEPSAMNP